MERFFKISSDLLCIATLSGRFLKLSDSWRHVLGHDLADLMSCSFLDFVHPDDRADTLRTLEDLGRGQRITGLVNRYRAKDGSYHYLSWNSALTVEDGLIFAVARDVSDEILQRQRIERQDRQLNEAMRLGRLGFWEHDILTGALYWSPQVFTILGLDPATFSLTYDAFLSVIHPDDRDAVDHAYRHALSERIPYAVCHRLCGEDRAPRWVQERGEVMYDDDGRPVRSIGTVQDVTEETRHRQQLADERARLRTIIDTIPDLLFIKDRSFRYIGCNRPFETFVGRNEAMLVGHDDFELFPQAVAEDFRGHDRAMIASGTCRRFEEWVTYPNGVRYLLDTIKVPLRDAAGQMTGLVGISRDITEQHLLRRDIDFMSALINRGRDPVYCASPSRGFALVYVNDAACALVGMSREDILGQPVSFFGPTMTQSWLDNVWQRIRGTDTSLILAIDLRLPDGRLLPAEISASFVPHGGEDYVVGSIRDVSARQTIEQQLREREALYRASIEATADGFWRVDSQGRILDVNTAYAHLSGYSVEELRAMSISDVEAIENPADTQARIGQIQARGTLIFESRHRRKDGSLWDVEVTTLGSDSGNGTCFAYLRDLRHRRRAETLLKTRLHLSTIGRTGDLGALITELLDAAERLTGSTIGFFHFVEADQQTLTMQAWSTNTLARMCDAEGTGRHYPVSEAGLWADCLRQGRAIICNDYPSARERRGLPPGHAPIHRMLTVPVPGENGFSAIIGLGNKTEPYDQDDLDIGIELAAMAMDIISWVRSEKTRRELAEALARTALQWTAAMDSFESGVAVLDDQHRLLRANAAFFALTASTPETRLGKVVHCLADIDQPRDTCPLCAELATPRVRRLVIEADAPGNPSGRPLEMTMSPIIDGENKAAGMVLSLYDLTKVREQEGHLQRTIAELTRSNAELERLAEVVAHDLQEPVRQQVLFAQLLERRLTGRLEPDVQDFLGFIVDGALAMRAKVQGLAVYGDLGRSNRPVEPVDLDQVAADVVNALRGEIEHSQAVVSLSPLGEVAGERSRLRLLLINLISNALKFRRANTNPHISVSAVTDNKTLTMAVADNGIGIPEEYRDDLFTLFRRLTPHQYPSGTGLGLAQCRRIVEDMGGRIWIEGNSSGGTTVRFALPLSGP